MHFARASGGLRAGRSIAFTFLIVLTLSLVVVAATLGQAPSASDKTVWDGVYSESQAKQGMAIYVDKCSECHDDGVMGPELDGRDFLADWASQSVGALYRQIKMTMPADDPGDLKDPQVLDLVAFILRANGFPAGDQALDNVSALDAIKFDGKK